MSLPVRISILDLNHDCLLEISSMLGEVDKLMLVFTSKDLWRLYRADAAGRSQSLVPAEMHICAKKSATLKQLDFLREAIKLNMNGHLHLFNINPNIPGLFKWVFDHLSVDRSRLLAAYGHLARHSNNFDIVYEAYQNVVKHRLESTNKLKYLPLREKSLRGLMSEDVLVMYNKWQTCSQSLMPKETYSNISVIAKYHISYIVIKELANLLPVLKEAGINWVSFCREATARDAKSLLKRAVDEGYVTLSGEKQTDEVSNNGS